MSLQSAHASGGDVTLHSSGSCFISLWKRQAHVISRQYWTLPRPLHLAVTKEYRSSATVTCICVVEGNFLNITLFLSVLCQVVYFSVFFNAGPHALTIAVFTLTGIVILVLIISLLILRYQFLWLSVCPWTVFLLGQCLWSLLEEPFIGLPYIPGWLPSLWTL